MKRIYRPILHGGLAVLMSAMFLLAQAVHPPMARAQTSAKTSSMVDVNSASAKTLETLPGVTPTLAKNIIAGRPYQSVADLGKVQGMSKSKLDAIKGDVTFGAASTTTAKTSSMVDVNSASAKTLETLPGVTPTLAKNIIAGRPYQSVADLGKVQGMSKSKLDAIKGDVTFGAASTTTAKKSTKKQSASNSTETAATPPPAATSTSGKETSSSTTGTTQTTPTPTGSASGKLAPGQTININSASAEELDALPGIGPTKAQAIVDYRNQHGNFKSIEDIENVKGIKSGEFSKIKDYIRVN